MRPLTPIRRGWKATVGEDISKHARPISIDHGALVVECKSSAWAQQLQLLTDRIRRAFPSVERLRLRVNGKPA